jgi:hypothetical protein
MPTLILKARSRSSFDTNVLMAVIDCIPGIQKPSIKELLTFYPEEIKINLTPGALESTAHRVFERLNGQFDIQYA